MEFKNLEILKKVSLFVFSTFFYFISSNRVYSQTIEEIKRDVTNIESIPSREKAEMNIEVTKMTSEKMKGKINLDEKTISLDFTDIEGRDAKNRIRILEEEYEILLVEDINTLSTYLINGIGIKKYNYKIVENNGERRVKIEYTEKPENLYMGIIDKKSGSLVKVFSISEFERDYGVETYAVQSASFGGASYMVYTYNNENCVLQDYGGNTASVLVSCTTVEAKQTGTANNVDGAAPAIAVGGSWTNSNTTLSTSSEVLLPTFNYSNGTTSVNTTIFLSTPTFGTGTNHYKRFLTVSNTERAKSYLSHGYQTNETMNAKLNMEISANELKKVRGITGTDVALNNNATNGTDQITFIYGQAVGTSNWRYDLPRKSGTNTDAQNIAAYSKAFKYPNLTIKKIVMGNEISLNFKDSYTQNTPLIFNEGGTSGYNATQLEIKKTGTHTDYFMTGLASAGTIEVKKDSYTGTLLHTYTVGGDGETTANTFYLTGKNGGTASVTLSYGTNGLATLSLGNWEKNDEYDIYITHKEASGLTRRENKVTIKNYTDVTGQISGAYMKYEYNNANCILQDFGGNTASIVERCTDIRVYQDANVTGATTGSFPAIGVGSGWVNTNSKLSETTTLPTHNYTDGQDLSISATIFLSNPRYVNGSSRYIRNLSTDTTRGKVYGNYSNNVAEGVTAQLNMELSATILKTIRNIGGQNVELANNIPQDTTNPEQLRLIYAQYVTTPSLAYNLPRKSGTNTEAQNINTYTKHYKYPNLTVKKINMENNIILNFKTGYTANTALTFNEAGTTGFTTTQLEVTKTGTHTDYFMTGLASAGQIEVRKDSYTGTLLHTYTVGADGTATPQNFSLTSSNGETANVTLSYGAHGVVILKLENWTGEGSYDLYITHKEASTLTRRKNKVTINTPVSGAVQTGTIGGSYMKYNYNDANCIVQDWGSNTSSILERCTDVMVYQDGAPTGGIAGSFPAIAVGSGWTNANSEISTTATLPSFNYTNGSNTITTIIFLSDPRYDAGGTYYKRYLNGSTPERGKVYGNYGSNAAESVTAKLNIEILSDELKKVRGIAGEIVTLSNNISDTTDQLRLIYGQFVTPNYNLPRGGNTANNISTYTKNIKYPNLIVKKINMENNIVLDFKTTYIPNTSLEFNATGTTGYNGEQLVVSKSGSHTDYFMTGLSSSGTVEFKTGGFTGTNITQKEVSDKGVIEATTLLLTGKAGHTANLSFNYREEGLVTVNLINWTGEDEYELYIIHKEASGLERRKYKVTIKTPLGDPRRFFQLVSKQDLEFGTIIKGFTGETATAKIEVSGLSSNGLILAPSKEKIELIKDTTSKIEVGSFTISKQGTTGADGIETYNLTGTVLKSSDATSSGEHTGTLQLNVEIVQPFTGVNRR